LLYQRDHHHSTVARLDIGTLSYESVIQFLDHLEKDRSVSVSTRNQRLAALRSLCRYILFRHPDHADTVSRCLAVPMKKHARKMRGFLETCEIEALLGAIDRRKWIGRRDYLMLNLAIQTGLRVSELTALRAEDFTLGRAPYITVQGKGRKERSVPIDKNLAKSVSRWFTSCLPNSATCMFPTAHGNRMSTDAVQHMLRKYVKIAETKEPTLQRKRISPHTLRHTTAMHMLNRGVAIEIIALWLGHEQIETTQIYFSESIAIKRKALKRTRFKSVIQPPLHKATDLSFLDDV
jgi:site-specific recombinase XerD